jgi:hypothetical protein
MSRASLQSICLAGVFALLSACGGGDDGPSGSKLFAGDSANQAIGSLINANPGPGALPVDRIIVGPSTQLSSSINGFALDAANDRLYVANGSSVLVFNNASGADGNVAPSRVLSTTGFGNNSLFLDTANDRLYVSDSTFGIRVYNSASSATNATPDRSITLSTGGTVYGVTVDVAKDILYALVTEASATFPYSVRVFDDAENLDGAETPSRTIELNSQITNSGLFLDAAADRLYIGTASTQVLVYESASAKTGTASTTPPDRTIVFPPIGPTKVAVDTVNNRLYAVSGSSGFILSNVSTANGAVAATQVFVSGANLTAVAIRP